jgi:hypothetical protein
MDIKIVEERILSIIKRLLAGDGYQSEKSTLNQFFESDNPRDLKVANTALDIYNLSTNSEYQEEEFPGSDYRVKIVDIDTKWPMVDISHTAGRSSIGFKVEDPKQEIPILIKKLEYLLKYKTENS